MELVLLTTLYSLQQWARFSLSFLSSVSTPGCHEACPEHEARAPRCSTWICEDDDAVCVACKACLVEHDAAHINLAFATCLSEAGYSFLVSYAFVAVFAVAGLGAGIAADGFNRRLILVLALIGIGSAMILQALAKDYEMLLGARLVLGFFSAFCTPTAVSLLKDIYPQRLGEVHGIYSFGIYFGSGLSSLLIIMARSIGWQSACHIIAGVVFGLVLLVLALFKEPQRDLSSSRVPLLPSTSTLQEEDEDPSSIEVEPPRAPLNEMTPEQLQQLQRHRERYVTLRRIIGVYRDPVVALIVLGSTLRFFGSFALGAYLPMFYKRKHPEENGIFSVLYAVFSSVGGALSAFTGGKLADRFGREGNDAARALVPGFGCLLAYPPLYAALSTDSFELSMTALIVSILLAECWYGSILSLIQKRVPGEIVGLTMATFLFFSNMLGNLSPVIIGKQEDKDGGGTSSSLESILITLTGFSYVSSAIVFLFAGRVISKEDA